MQTISKNSLTQDLNNIKVDLRLLAMYRERLCLSPDSRSGTLNGGKVQSEGHRCPKK